MEADELGEQLRQWAGLRRAAVKPRTQKYHEELIGVILREWPPNSPRQISAITEKDLIAFADRVKNFSASRWNGMLSMIRAAVPIAMKLRRRRIKLRDRHIMSRDDFARLLDALDARPQSKAGLVIRFLAHTGFRIDEARNLQWSHVQADYIFAPGEITKSGKPRFVRFIQGTKEMLAKLMAVTGSQPFILPQKECKRSLDKACEAAKIPHLSHHDFRHLFATRCIQSGVDIPTVARWLGHRDGGALLGKVYFHLVDEHSRTMAAKVKI